MYTIAVSTNAYVGFTLDDALRGISKAGFKNVELNLSENKEWEKQITGDLNALEIEEFRKKLEFYGLYPVSISGFGQIVIRKRHEEFIKLFSVAGKLGCKYIIHTLDAPMGEEMDVKEESDLIPVLRTMGDACAKNNFILLLELHGNYASGALMSSLIRKVAHPAVKMNYDTGNIIYFRGEEPYGDLKENLKYALGIHLKDNIGGKGVWNFPAIGCGEIDMIRIFKIIEDGGYSSLITLEIEYTPAGPGSIENADATVQKSCDYLKKIGVQIG